MKIRRIFGACVVLIATCLTGSIVITHSLQPLPESLKALLAGGKLQIRDRFGKPLSFTYANEWNLSDYRPLHTIPPLLQQAFISAEDKRFYQHYGVDWRARAHAVWQNITALRVVRGASTITEQVVRMLHPRPRSVWSRFIEGIEARRLEQRFSKADILEFYLNQVPFTARRRGVTQAARYFWDRDLDTLSLKESLALAVMVRAPARLGARLDTAPLERGISQLASRLVKDGSITRNESLPIASEKLSETKGTLPVQAPHFVRYIQAHSNESTERGYIYSTLHSHIQEEVQRILQSRVCDLSSAQVANGAVLVVDTARAEVLAWVNAEGCHGEESSQIDAVTSPRQPGSTLKPFLYALALAKGWTAATMLDDAPLAEAVGTGLHAYHNYSRTHYGRLTVRAALGNSLNIPAVRTIHFTGSAPFLEFLRTAGFDSLTKPAEFYGEGLALGNGEVTLFELVQAYTALASRGLFRPLKVVHSSDNRALSTKTRRIVSPEVSSIISDILSDPQARRIEFGRDGVLRFPVQTAVKTGTSSDFRDAWALGYSRNFTVGVWMGNLNRTSMFEVSGARGPALILRSIFAKLEKLRDSRDLFISPSLNRQTICPLSGMLATDSCPHLEELFIAGSTPRATCRAKHVLSDQEPAPTNDYLSPPAVRVALPSPGLRLAKDPRIPDELEAFAFELDSASPPSEVTWVVDDYDLATLSGPNSRYLWNLQPGRHLVKARVRFGEAARAVETATVEFFVR
jgi:penicillin-binding protein 1C